VVLPVIDDFADMTKFAPKFAVAMFKSAVAFPTWPDNSPVVGLRPEWLPVFDVRTFIRTGTELHVLDDRDASSQLDVLAPGLAVPREAITIKPRRGWQGYGLPTPAR
jgi:hypothetical protein